MFRIQSTALLILLALACTADAWSSSSPQSPESRRAWFQRTVAATATAVATSSAGLPLASYAAPAKTGAASPFTGDYNDPQHPSCLRQVKVVGAPIRGDGTRSLVPVVEIRGYDGGSSSSDGNACTARPNSRDDLWTVRGKITSTNQAVLDFSPKGGPTALQATYEDGGIVFPDGNKWTKLPVVDTKRYPVNMGTLKSLD